MEAAWNIFLIMFAVFMALPAAAIVCLLVIAVIGWVIAAPFMLYDKLTNWGKSDLQQYSKRSKDIFK